MVVKLVGLTNRRGRSQGGDSEGIYLGKVRLVQTRHLLFLFISWGASRMGSWGIWDSANGERGKLLRGLSYAKDKRHFI